MIERAFSPLLLAQPVLPNFWVLAHHSTQDHKLSRTDVQDLEDLGRAIRPPAGTFQKQPPGDPIAGPWGANVTETGFPEVGLRSRRTPGVPGVLVSIGLLEAKATRRAGILHRRMVTA
ncbi:MAG: hypothetical protein M1115_01695 [Actinobacteria bacterium]|nr:hypothetical protein [Actinomycetota bacterium]